jgi:hypothetical protein
MFRTIVFLISHGMAMAAGVALGIYLLPILTAPAGPSDAEIAAASSKALFSTRFSRDLPGSDFLHWGEGEVSISMRRISFSGELAPGPDYRLYLTPEVAFDEQTFLTQKSRSAYIGEIKSFDNFILNIPENVNASNFKGVIVWCETFSQFITAAEYR